MENAESEAKPVPWTARDVWLGVGLLAVWMIALLGISVLIRLTGVEVDLGLFTGLGELLLLVPVWWLTVRKYGAGWQALGLRGFQGGTLALGCGLMILSYLFNVLYASLLGLFDLRMQVDLVAVFAELDSPWWLLLAGTVVAPVVEEVFFRGFVFAGLIQRYTWQKAALLSSGLFALIHLQPTALIPTFILGYIFAYLYHRSRSIWPAILMHVSTNTLALGAAYLLAETGLANGLP